MMKRQMKADAYTLKAPAELKQGIDKKTGYTLEDNEEYQAELEDEYEEEEPVGGGVSDPPREPQQQEEPQTGAEKIMSFKNVMLLLASGLILLFLNN
ncbi:MAG: hypothetical protein ACI4F6_00860 [Acutalibacteraceae bacterium]